jgi:hypothetical protein
MIVKRMSVLCFASVAVALALGYAQVAWCDDTVDPDPEYYAYHPMSTMALGRGLSPSDVATSKVPCFSFTSTDLDGPSTALTTYFTEQLVSNAEQLKSALNVDTKVDASFLSFNGGANFTYSDTELFSGSSVTVVIRANAEYSRQGIKDWSFLNDTVKAELRDTKKFERDCGSRFIDVVRRGASVAAIVTIYGVNQDDKNDIVTSVGGGGGIGGFSAHAKATITNQFARAQQARELNVQVVATGGTGLSALGDVIKAMVPGDNVLSQIELSLGDYMKQFSAANAAPIGFHVVNMSFSGWDPTSADLWTEQKEERLRIIVSAYRAVEKKRDVANSVLSGNDVRRRLIPPSKDDDLRKAIKAYEQRLQVLANLHKACKADQGDGNNCDLPEWTEPTDVVPALPEAPTGRYVIVAYPNSGEPTKWNAVRSRGFLSGFWIWNHHWDDSARHVNTGGIDRNLDARVKSVDMSVRAADVEFELDAHDIVSAQLAFKTDGQNNVADVKPLPVSNEYWMWYGGLATLNLRDAIVQDVYSVDVPMNGQLGQVDKSGLYVLHLIDAYNRDFMLPLAGLRLHIDHKKEGSWIPFKPIEEIELKPAFR